MQLRITTLSRTRKKEEIGNVFSSCLGSVDFEECEAYAARRSMRELMTREDFEELATVALGTEVGGGARRLDP